MARTSLSPYLPPKPNQEPELVFALAASSDTLSDAWEAPLWNDLSNLSTAELKSFSVSFFRLSNFFSASDAYLLIVESNSPALALAALSYEWY